MKTTTFIGLNVQEHIRVNHLKKEGIINDGFDILFVGFDTKVEEIEGLIPNFYKEIILLYSGSSIVSEYLDRLGIPYSRISRYCDDAVVTHQIQKVIELTERKRDLNQLNYLSWGEGYIADRFHTLFPHFKYTEVDPNTDDISDLRMSELCEDIDVILINHSHHKFNSKWLRGNKNQIEGYNHTILINSSREGAIDFSIYPKELFPRFYSDVDGPNAPHLFFESEDTYNNIKNFIRTKVK